MKHSENYEKIKGWYAMKMWDINRIFNVVGKAITEQKYQEITGLEYPNKGKAE